MFSAALPMAPDVSGSEPEPARAPALAAADWRRIRDALRYQARDLHHRSYAVHGSRRSLLWEEMDDCLALADRLEPLLAGGPQQGLDPEDRDPSDHDPPERGLEQPIS